MKSSSRVKGPPVIEPVRCSGSEPSSSEKKKVCRTKKKYPNSDIISRQYVTNPT